MNTTDALKICTDHYMTAWIIPNGIAIEVELCTASGNWVREVVPCCPRLLIPDTRGWVGGTEGLEIGVLGQCTQTQFFINSDTMTH